MGNENKDKSGNSSYGNDPDTANAANADRRAAPQDPILVLASVHTSNFPELLNHFKSTLAVTTYQAGKLVLLRADGNAVNTHFHAFNRPMGLAADNERLALRSTWPGADTSPVPSTFMKWLGTGMANCGSSTRCSHACARWTQNRASCRAGALLLSATMHRRIAAI